MIVLKDNGVVYLAESAAFSLCGGYETQATEQMPENVQVWRVPGTDIVACVCGSGFEADVLRYEDDVITGELTMDKLVLETVPGIKYILEHFGKIDDDDEMNVEIAFAQGDKAFVIDTRFCVTEITDYAAFSNRSERGLAALHIAKNLPPEERILYAQRIRNENDRCVMSVIDTKTLNPRIIGA